MVFISPDYYYNDFGGTAPNDDIDKLIKRASNMIDIACNAQISNMGGIEKINSEYVKDAIRSATAAQVEFLFKNGGADEAVCQNPVKMSLGNFSYTSNYAIKSSAAQNYSETYFSPLAIAQLEKVGLAFRGVSVV